MRPLAKVFFCLDFYLRASLCLVWLLIMSLVGLALVPILCWGKKLNSTVAHFGAWGLQRILRIWIRLDSPQDLAASQPCVYVANHQHNLDILVYGAIFPDSTVVIGKKEIGWIPFFNLFYVAGGNVLLDRKHRTRAISGIMEAGSRMREQGKSVLIFPEGTRNRLGSELLPFKKGAFHLAIAGQLPIVPLVAAPLGRLIQDRDLGNLRIHPGVVVVRRLEPISTQGLTQSDLQPLMQRVRDAMAAEFEILSQQPS